MKDFTFPIGNTPLIRLEKNIFAKSEFLNPSGSIKDRIAKEIIEQAEKKRLLDKKKTILEVSGGNTGISLAVLCKAKGYKCEIIVPKHTGPKAIKQIIKYGGKVKVVKDFLEAEKLAKKKIEKKPHKYFYADQSNNPATINANKRLGREILRQFDKKIDYFVAASGTGGTICGVSLVLKKRFPEMKSIAVLPQEHTKISAVYNFRKSNKTGILEKYGSIIDKTFTVPDKTALKESGYIKKKFGLPAGPTSWMAYHAAKKLRGNIVMVFADSIDRYK